MMKIKEKTNVLFPTGSWVALITPFTAEGEVDMKGFATLVDFHVANNTDGLLFMGSTGETTSLFPQERREIIRSMTKYCREKIPAFFGVTCPTTKATTELARFAQDEGALGILLTVPPYVAPPQEAVYEYFAEIARSVSLSVALYNNPGRVSVNINPDTVARLADFPNVVADKEATASVEHLTEVMGKVEGKLHLLCCDYPKYSLILPTLAMGGKGTANVAGNVIPREMALMSSPWESFEDTKRSRELYFDWLPLLKMLYSVSNPVVVKAAVEVLGFPAGPPRPPLPKLKGEKLEILKKMLDDLGVSGHYGIRRKGEHNG